MDLETQRASFQHLRVALIHDWLTGMRGGEAVLVALAELFPQAELFTLLYVPGRIAPELTVLKRHTSLLQKVPHIEKRYRFFLPAMPFLIERFDLTGFDLILSSSHCVAKGIRKPPQAFHFSYIHAPMRYMWDRFEDYFGLGRSSPWVRWAARGFRAFLQRWDQRVSSVERIDGVMANSRFVASQIQRFYGRKDTVVIHPFAQPSFFSQPRKPGQIYLMVSALVPYKRVDLAIEAFNRLQLSLVIIGSGPEEKRLKKQAGPTITFLGHLSQAAMADFYAKCRALIFPGIEDFGITPLEAMAAGAPVIAYAQGGVLETVTSETGLFFHSQTPEALCEAVLRLERGEWKATEEACRSRAALFTRERFQEQVLAHVAQVLERKKSPKPVSITTSPLKTSP